MVLAIARLMKMDAVVIRWAHDKSRAYKEIFKKVIAKHKAKEKCQERGYHDFQEFIDPVFGGFSRCKDCGHEEIEDCEG